MPLRGGQGQGVQWDWKIKEVMGGGDSHIRPMGSLEASTSSCCGGSTQHQTLFARTSFCARTMTAAGAEHTQSTSEHLHQGDAIEFPRKGACGSILGGNSLG